MSRQGHLLLAQRFNAGAWERPLSTSPVGTIEVSFVPTGLGSLCFARTPALRAGLSSLRPYGTAQQPADSVTDPSSVALDDHPDKLAGPCYIGILPAARGGGPTLHQPGPCSV